MEISINIRSYCADSELHNHEFHQIVLPRHGELEIEVAGRGGIVNRRRGVFLPAGDRHDFRASGRNAFFVIDAPHHFFEKPLKSATYEGRSQSNEASALDRLCRSHFFDIGPQSAPFLAGICALQSSEADQEMIDVWTRMLVRHLGAETNSGDYSARPIVTRALDFMRDHVDATISVPKIAREAGASRSSLYQYFKAETGKPPHAWLRDERLDRALDLLAGSSLSIDEIAVMSGYEGRSAFTRALKDKRGVTPGAWRRQARNQEGATVGSAAPREGVIVGGARTRKESGIDACRFANDDAMSAA